MLGLKPIYLPSARERVASELRKAIISRQIKEGDMLTLESIASMLQVSVTPVREAFQILARDGLIEQRHNKGAVVLGVTEKYIREHYELRAVLESYAAHQASMPETDIHAIEEIYQTAETFVEKGDYADYADYNFAFHYEIWKAAGNERMVNILAELWNGLSMGNVVTVDQYIQVSCREHKTILEAIQCHDSTLAQKRMHEHIKRSMEDMLTHYN